MSAPVAGSALPALATAHLRSTTNARQRRFLRPRIRLAAAGKRGKFSTMMRPPTQSAPGSCKGSRGATRTMRSTACLKATAGRPGISQRQRSAARSRTRHGWSPTSQRSSTNSASSRQEKKLTYFSFRRGVPGTDRSCLLAAKRYRDATHRQFHRDVGYLEGRRVRESRVNRAVVKRSEFGREAIAGQWANAEFNALVQLHSFGVPVPYPVQILGKEILLEFVGDAEALGASPRRDPPGAGRTR